MLVVRLKSHNGVASHQEEGGFECVDGDQVRKLIQSIAFIGPVLALGPLVTTKSPGRFPLATVSTWAVPS